MDENKDLEARVKEALNKAKADEEDLDEFLKAQSKAKENKEDTKVENEGKAVEETAEAEELDAEEEEDVLDDEMEEEDVEADDENPAHEDAEKKGLFGRKKKKDKRDEKIEELTDRLTRQMAEFDNFRKRTEKEKSQMYAIGAREVVEKLLPVVDNFERGLGQVAEEDKNDAFVDGMDMVYKQLMTTLESVGVKPIEAVGQPFNPDYHNAVMHIEDEEYGENIVVEEFQKGYLYKETVVRFSMVKVAN